MNSKDEGMQPLGLERALTLVADEVGEPDVAEAAWRQGRRARRRDHVVAGALAAGAVVVSALGWSLLPRDVAVEPAGESATVTSEVAVTEEPSRLRDNAALVRSSLEAGCLRELGWTVTSGPGGGWESAQMPSTREPRDLRADLDRCAGAMGLGTVIGSSEETGGLTAQDEARVREIYREYARVGDCLQERASVAVWVPDEESFVSAYPVGVSPPWHPYTAIAAQTWRLNEGPLKLAAERCPVEVTWEDR